MLATYRSRLRVRDFLTLATLVGGAVALFLVGLSGWLTVRASREAARLAPLGHAVGLRLYAAHLGAEQALHGDTAVDVPRQVYGNLDAAVQLVQEILVERPGETLSPAPRLTDPTLRQHVALLAQLIGDQRRRTERRLNDPAQGGGAAEDNQAFRRLATFVEAVSAEERALAFRRSRQVLGVDGLVAGSILLLFAAIVGFARRSRATSEGRRVELERRVNSRTSELRDRDERLRAIVDTAVDGVVTLDERGNVSSWNPAAGRIFGYRAAEVIGRDVEILLPVKLRPLLAGGVGRFLRSRGRRFLGRVGEAVGRRRDGSEVPLDLAISEFKVGGRPAFAGIVRDITERAENQRLLRQAKEVAERAAKAKSEFLANMSHEIRTPLNAVIGMTGLLLETGLDAEQRDFAETVRRAGEGLLEIINDILDFSKIEAGHPELEERSFEVQACVEEVFDLVASRAAEKGLELLYQLADDVPATLQGDVGRVRQVLLNLVGNAVKFTERGEVFVRAEAQPMDGERYQVLFAVEDSGIGIPADRMDRLFQSFSQVDTSATRRFSGTGLGLAISKRLAEAMGGGLSVNSELGRGSVFFFSLVAPKGAPSPARRPGRTPRLEGKRVLLVDDNATNLRILTAQCSRWGLTAHATAAPGMALQWLREGAPFDLAILDMRMPEMDGLALARAIRELRGADVLSLVLLSSLGSRPGGDGLDLFSVSLAKPVKEAALYAALVAALTGTGAPPAARQEPAAAPGDWRAAGDLRVLLVEDNPVNQKVCLRILSRYGVRADLVENGREAVETLARQPYDVVLMDVQMPEMDGCEATRRIRARTDAAQPWIVAMTAGALEGDRDRCFAAGMDDYVSKPMRVDELVAALRRHESHRAAGP